jgi:hypothetical protein
MATLSHRPPFRGVLRCNDVNSRYVPSSSPSSLTSSVCRFCCPRGRNGDNDNDDNDDDDDDDDNEENKNNNDNDENDDGCCDTWPALALSGGERSRPSRAIPPSKYQVWQGQLGLGDVFIVSPPLPPLCPGQLPLHLPPPPPPLGTLFLADAIAAGGTVVLAYSALGGSASRFSSLRCV